MKYPIPEAALQQHIAVLGKTGSGKTFAVKGIVEHLLEAGRHVGIVDPTDAWWGLRSSRDGKGPGFPILVLGGDHGDLPLPALGGAAVARLLVEQGVNLVASTKHLTVGERTRWFIDFAGTINRLNRTPLHLVIDEAHNFAPQGKVPDPDTGKMLHAMNTLASGGRSIGIRLAMLTQRPQKLHKDTLTSADTLIAMRVLAPHDRQAVEDWIKGCGDIAQGKEVLNSLASLQRGEGWVWYPEGGFLQRMKFPMIRTFDSSASPTEGHALTAPKGAAEIDLTEIRAAMADAVKDAEANDPKLLRAEVTKLKRELEKKSEDGQTKEWRAKYEQAHALDTAEAYKHGQIDGYKKGIKDFVGRLKTLHDEILALNDDILKWVEKDENAGASNVHVSRTHPKRMSVDIQVIDDRPHWMMDKKQPLQGAISGGKAKSSGLRRMMIALAQRPAGLNRRQLGVRAGLSSSSGTFSTYLGKGRSEGWLNGDGSNIRITDSGIAALGQYDPLPTGQALLAYWLGELGNSGAARLLQAVSDAYPKGLSRDVAAERANLAPGSGTFSTYLGKLRTLELISGSGELRASEELFE